MKVIVQRSLDSFVMVEKKIVSQIPKGLVLLVCIEKGDDLHKIEKAAQKIINLRCFENLEKKKMDFSIREIEGEILAISQFTLSWNGQKGNRPGFENSMEPLMAQKLFNQFCDELSKSVKVLKGYFGVIPLGV